MKTQYKNIKNSLLKYRRSEQGIARIIYQNQKTNSKKNPLKKPDYTSDSFKEWLLEQSKWKAIHKNWVKSEYKTDLYPSVDRINPMLPYRLDNLQILTWGNNFKKSLKERTLTQGKRITQMSKSKEKVNNFNSIMEASRKTGIDYRTIGNALTGHRKTAGGYIWLYAKSQRLDLWNKVNGKN